MLTETFGIYQCPECEQSGSLIDIFDDNNNECKMCGVEIESSELKYVGEENAKFWSVALYTITREYGGPEEGGWYYDCLEVVYPEKARIFESYKASKEYFNKLANNHMFNYGITVKGFTNKFPDTYFPKTKPKYR